MPRRAVIDIGTNSVKLLVADVARGRVRPWHEDSKQTRLGRGFYRTRRLQREPVAKTARAVAHFAAQAHAWKAKTLRVIATSAARDAKNPELLLDAVKRATGLAVEIISGGQEADWAFQGVLTDARLRRHPLVLLDAGGGSTEFILGHGNHQHFRHSFPLGTVRLLERFPVSNPPMAAELAGVRQWLRKFLRTRVRPSLAPALRHAALSASTAGGLRLLGTGGTASILARMQARMTGFEREGIERTRLPLAQVRAHAEKLWRLPLARRRRIVGLPPKRADVILMGVLIYEAVMEEFGFETLRVSTRGLRFAAVMDAA